METYRGHVRNPADAIKLFEACRRGLLPRVQRRLSEKERQSIQSGSVFVWDEREAGMRRWTDGKSWSASRVSGSFLTYREMEGKRGGGSFVPAPRRVGGKTPDSGRASDEDADMDGDGADGYRYKADGLMKQSFSITTSEGQHLHLISYYARPHSNMVELPQPSTDPALRNVIPPKGMYPESTAHETAPPMRSMPMQHSYMSSPQHSLGGPPPQGMPRMPYPYQQGYPPWPPSPMSTPPYGYPPNGYASQLPSPMNGHPGPYHPQHQHLPPHPKQHMSPQAYDRPPPPAPLNLPPGPHDPTRFPGHLPQISANTYRPSSMSDMGRHPSDASLSGQARHLSQPIIDTRLPPPLQHQHSAPAPRDPREMEQINTHYAQDTRLPPPLQHQHSAPPSRDREAEQIQMNGSPLERGLSLQGGDSRLPPPLQHQYQNQHQPREVEQTNSYTTDRRSPSQGREATVPATTLTPETAARSTSGSPAKRIYQSFSADEAPAPASATVTSATATEDTATTPASKTPELPTADIAQSSSATPGASDSAAADAQATEAQTQTQEAQAPSATDIPHAKLAVGGPAGFSGEDLRAIRVLDRKFCI